MTIVFLKAPLRAFSWLRSLFLKYIHTNDAPKAYSNAQNRILNYHPIINTVCERRVLLELFILFYLILDSFLHGPKVHWDMRCICDQATIRAKHGTREVQPLLDIRRY